MAKIKVTNLQRQFNKYIKERDCQGDYGICATCGNLLPSKSTGLHAGHFLCTGGYPSVRFDERQVHLQCANCNLKKGGTPVEYYRYMKDAYGEEFIDLLTFRGRIPIKWSQTRLNRIRDLIKQARKTREDQAEFNTVIYENYAGPEWD